MFSFGAMVALNLNISLTLRGKREKVFKYFRLFRSISPILLEKFQACGISLCLKNNEPLNFWIISCDYFAFFSPRARLLFQPEEADRRSKLFRSPVNCSRHACFDVCRLYSLVCCCRRSEDRGRGGGVHVGGKPGQHQLWGGGSPRSLGDLVQRRPPAALCQLHQLEDPQHANQQLPGGLLHLPDIQKKKHNEAVFAINWKLRFLAGHVCCQILLDFVSATAVVS